MNIKKFPLKKYLTISKKIYKIKGILQPADVGWFKALKSQYRKLWLNWFLNDEKIITKHGNLAGPGYANISKWLLECWEKLDQASIIHSFQYCGITSETPHDYHSELKELLQSKELPPNVTVEILEEMHDPNIVNCFTEFGYEDNETYFEEEDVDYVPSETEESDSISEEDTTSEDLSNEEENSSNQGRRKILIKNSLNLQIKLKFKNYL